MRVRPRAEWAQSDIYLKGGKNWGSKPQVQPDQRALKAGGK